MGLEMLGFLTRDDILAAQDIEREEVSCPEWGGKVIVRTMTGEERDQLEIASMGSTREQNLSNYRAKTAVFSCINEAGERLFTISDIAALTKKSSKPLDRIMTVAFRLSGISSKDVEETVKNSESGQSDGSGM